MYSLREIHQDDMMGRRIGRVFPSNPPILSPERSDMNNEDSQAAVIFNDLDSLVHRIEALPAHPAYTDALIGVSEARRSIQIGRAALHKASMDARYTK